MNPRSGGGKVARFGLPGQADRGAEVALLEGPGHVDVGALARRAVDKGADLLGVAGGDGTQALVAGIAARRDVPMLVISAGTRNHFALDLGLDRDDPAAGLDALGGAGVEIRIDLGEIAGRIGTFVNNASFGAYAQVVQSPAYRDDKAGTALEMLPGLLRRHRRRAADRRVDGQVAGRPAGGAGQQQPLRDRRHRGAGPAGAAGHRPAGRRGRARGRGARRRRCCAGRRASRGLTVADRAGGHHRVGQPQIPVGIDGEAVVLPAPVRCTIAPLALRVRVPAGRPGVPAPRRN